MKHLLMLVFLFFSKAFVVKNGWDQIATELSSMTDIQSSRWITLSCLQEVSKKRLTIIEALKFF